MPLTAISIQGYRSIQRLHFAVDVSSIFIGAKGVGKTNLYIEGLMLSGEISDDED